MIDLSDYLQRKEIKDRGSHFERQWMGIAADAPYVESLKITIQKIT